MIDLLLGLQWGDEGKGKIVDVLTSEYDIVARFQGGPNAGHTLEFDNKNYVALNQLANLYLKEGAIKLAEENYIKAINLNKPIQFVTLNVVMWV